MGTYRWVSSGAIGKQTIWYKWRTIKGYLVVQQQTKAPFSHFLPLLKPRRGFCADKLHQNRRRQSDSIAQTSRWSWTDCQQWFSSTWVMATVWPSALSNQMAALPPDTMTPPSQHLTVNMSETSRLPEAFLLIHCDNVCFFSPLHESHSEWLLSGIIISVTSRLTLLSTPRARLRKSDAYMSARSFPITEVQGLAGEGKACRWHHAAPWTAVRMSQVNVGRLKVAVFLMSGNKILLQ